MVCPDSVFWTSSELALTAAIVPEAPGSVLGVVDEPDGEPEGDAGADVAVDAPDEPPQAANASPAAPTAPSTAIRRVGRLRRRGCVRVVPVGVLLGLCMAASFVVAGVDRLGMWGVGFMWWVGRARWTHSLRRASMGGSLAARLAG